MPVECETNIDLTTATGNVDLKVIKQLQCGGSGDVFLAEEISKSKIVAIKVVPFKSNSMRAKFISEAVTSELLSPCEHIVNTLGHVLTNSYGCLIMEAMEGDLLDRISDFRGERRSKPLLKQISNALQFCHQLGFAHLDIKPENILLDREGNAHLCDFGHTHRLTARVETLTGTHLYNPPEVYNSLHKFTFDKAAADIWSLGVLIHIIVTGNYPFAGTTEAEIQFEARIGRVYLSDLELCSSACQDLVTKMLSLDPTQRPSISEVLQHPWFL
mmetsp:Transcript_14339/g.18192  ORF Transcript_14339/g.18192 Transcript_14339/m.18192 type:complete len:272 (-) Transcript_14339:52-867(-)